MKLLGGGDKVSTYDTIWIMSHYAIKFLASLFLSIEENKLIRPPNSPIVHYQQNERNQGNQQQADTKWCSHNVGFAIGNLLFCRIISLNRFVRHVQCLLDLTCSPSFVKMSFLQISSWCITLRFETKMQQKLHFLNPYQLRHFRWLQ